MITNLSITRAFARCEYYETFETLADMLDFVQEEQIFLTSAPFLIYFRDDTGFQTISAHLEDVLLVIDYATFKY